MADLAHTSDPLVLYLMLHSARETSSVWEGLAQSYKAQLENLQEELVALNQENKALRRQVKLLKSR